MIYDDVVEYLSLCDIIFSILVYNNKFTYGRKKKNVS